MKISGLPLVLLAGTLLAGGCRPASEGSAAIRRLDRELASGHLPADSAGRRATRALFAASGYGVPTDSSVTLYSSMPSISAHRAGVDSVFPDLATQESELGGVFARLEKLFPGFRSPHLYAIVSPFNQSVIVADTVVFIGLNHYLGEGYAPYGYFPEFVRHRKVASRIAPDVAEAIVRARYPFVPSSDYPTLLSRLIYEGAVTLAVMEAAGVDEAGAIGYTPAEAAMVRGQETAIWNTLLERGLLYSTDGAVARSLVTLSPASTVISPEVPGAVGRYFGARIVDAYLRSHPSATLESILLAPPDEGPFLRESGY